MTDDREPGRSWWTTLPGVLTALTGLLGAIATLIVVIRPANPQTTPPVTPHSPPAVSHSNGWYGWDCSQTKPNCDQEDKLHSLVGSFSRIMVEQSFINKNGWKLRAICESLEMQCVKAISWEGLAADCDKVDLNTYPNSGDGSQLARCEH